jgi:hypothetical protein
VTNPASFSRAPETISLSWKDLLKHAPGLAPAVVGVWGKHGAIPSQLIDADADGVPEVLLFQSAFGAGETKTFTVNAKAPRIQFPSLVDARFVLPRKDLAWENDRIAFRIYGSPLAGDVRNGIDVWTKRVRALIVQKWYKESEEVRWAKTYHRSGEGPTSA